MTALKNEIIFTDCLTGLYNREYLEFLHKRACNKKDCWVSGIMIDLNGFKQINDNYGHAEGDLALCIVADLLLKSFSEYGVVTRYAGDEFVIMLNYRHLKSKSSCLKNREIVKLKKKEMHSS